MSVLRILPGIDRVVSPGQTVEPLAEGFGGPLGPAEGPLWWKEGGYLLFSDIGNDRRMRWTPGQGVTVDSEPTEFANGLTRDRQGRLVACEHVTRRVVRIEPDGSMTVIANNYRGMRLNRPNDVVVKSDGSIYFTDPVTNGRWDASPAMPWDMDVRGVYRVAPDLSGINLLVRDAAYPNGLAFSPDEKILYFSDSRHRNIRAIDVDPTGLLDPSSDRVLIELRGQETGSADGLKVDMEGNLYSTAPGGVWIITPDGQHLGTIQSEERVTNIGWGGDDWTTLFLTKGTTLASIRLGIPGVPVPRGPI